MVQRRIVVSDTGLGKVVRGVIEHTLRNDTGSDADIVFTSELEGVADYGWGEVKNFVQVRLARRYQFLLDETAPGQTLFLNGSLFPQTRLDQLFDAASDHFCYAFPHDGEECQVGQLEGFIVNHDADNAGEIRDGLRPAMAGHYDAANEYGLACEPLPDDFAPAGVGKRFDMPIVDFRALDEKPWLWADAPGNRLWLPLFRAALSAGVISRDDIDADIEARLVRPSLAYPPTQGEGNECLMSQSVSEIDRQYMPQSMINSDALIKILESMTFELPKRAGVKAKTEKNANREKQSAKFASRAFRPESKPSLLRRMPGILKRAARDPKGYARKVVDRLRGRFS